MHLQPIVREQHAPLAAKRKGSGLRDYGQQVIMSAEVYRVKMHTADIKLCSCLCGLQNGFLARQQAKG